MFRHALTAMTLGAGLLAASLSAQVPQANVYFGVGTATNSSNGQSLDILGTGTPINTPKLTGAFLTAGGGLMLTDHFGAGANISWRASSGDYSGVNYRPIFYDFNGIWQPVKTKRFVPEIQAGLGGVAVHFSANTTSCDALTGCQNVSLGSESSSHFQVHGAAAVRLYVTPRLFLRPAVDLRYVNNFFQFGHDFVPEYSVGIGYSFGGE